MATEVVFDNATLSDAINKAGRVAPTKGKGFDQAAGLQFSVWPKERVCQIRATNMEVTFETNVDLLEGGGDQKTWRLPSGLLTSLVSTLPMGDGASVKFIDQGHDQAIRLTSGRTIAKINMYEGLLDEGIFKWQPEGDLTLAHHLASRVEQVAWATDSKSAILAGVNIDGTHLVATDTQVMAMVPADIPLPHPMTVPLSNLTALVSGATDCRIGIMGKRALIMLDDHTRASTVLMEGAYPNVKRVQRDNFIGSVKIHRQQFTDTLERLMVLARVEKMPALRLEINGGGLVSILTLDLNIPDVGRMRDSVDVETDFESVYEVSFTPTKIEQAVSHCKSDYMYFDFGHPDPVKSSLAIMQIRDDKDYIAYVMPRNV